MLTTALMADVLSATLPNSVSLSSTLTSIEEDPTLATGLSHSFIFKFIIRIYLLMS